MVIAHGKDYINDLSSDNEEARENCFEATVIFDFFFYFYFLLKFFFLRLCFS